MIFPFIKPMLKHSIAGHLSDASQTLLITPSVLQHVSQHRQSTPWATEAGGQLFGTIDAAQICITEATGPYTGDERSRDRYRSHPAAAQKAINDQHNRGLLYLGEWHTHAEDYPSASALDEDAMRRLINSSLLNSNTLLMMIVGRAQGTAGFAVWSVSYNTADRWSLRANKKEESLT